MLFCWGTCYAVGVVSFCDRQIISLGFVLCFTSYVSGIIFGIHIIELMIIHYSLRNFPYKIIFKILAHLSWFFPDASHFPQADKSEIG